MLLILTPAVILGETNNGNPENSSGSSDRIIENAESENINKDNSGKDIEEAPKNNNINENANDPVNTDKIQLQKDDNSKKTEQIQAPVIRNLPLNAAGDGLLEISDEEFKYNRIPGITIQKKKKIIAPPEEIKNVSDKKQSSDPEEARGLFGLKKSTTGVLVKILLIIFIIAVIVIFKIRPKIKKDGKVLRRFPGA